MIILELRKTIYCTGWSFYILWILGLTAKKYDFGWHYPLLTVWKKSWKIANVKHCYAHCKWINGKLQLTGQVGLCFFLEGLILYSSEFLVHFANVSCTCFNFHRVIFRTWICGTSLQSIEMGCWETAGPTYQSNTSRLLTGSDVGGMGTTKIGAWIVWWQYWCKQVKLRRRPSRMMYWRLQLLHTRWRELV